MKKYFPWILRIVPAVIMLQTLAFKFTGHPQSVELFTELSLLGMDESVGRIGVGVAELIASVLLLIPRTSFFGALGTIGLMSGALFFHFTVLGFEGADGQLVVMAVIALVLAVILALREKKNL